jgi:transcription elongation factor SPT5
MVSEIFDKARASKWELGSVRAIFGRVTLPGSIFIEAPELSDVRRACLSLVPTSRIDQARIIPVTRALDTLRISVDYTPARHHWIRLKKGLYKDDLAFITEVDKRTLEVYTLLVPRISLQPTKGKKRKSTFSPSRSRPSPQIFDSTLIEGIYGPGSVIPCNQVFKFQDRTYVKGFVELILDRGDFYNLDAIPTYEELEAFCRCPDIDVGVLAKAYELAGRGALKSGDRVQIVSGQHNGLIGLIRRVVGDEIEVVIISLSLIVTLRADAVRKSLRIGDEVIIRSGEHVGLTGLVVAVGNGARLDICDYTSKTVVRDLTVCTPPR